MKILAIDTSATAASTAICDENKIIGEFFINTKLTHSRTLMPMVESLLANTNLTTTDITAVAVNCGPGSFTGVRIGVAAAKGLAFADDLPCIEVSTLESLAYNLQSANGIICSVMDARCSQVYNALFKCDGVKPERLCKDRALSVAELSEELKSYDERIILVGDGAELCYNAMKELLPNVELAPISIRFQRASSTAEIAVQKFNDGEVLSAAELMPMYLRLPQAERELKKKMEEKKCEHLDVTTADITLSAQLKNILTKRVLNIKILVLTAQTALIILFTAIKLQKQ